MLKYSIVIPTYNHCDDLLKPCLESIEKYTSMHDVEVIVVANGCVDNTQEFVNSLGPKYRLIWCEESVGYTKATNIGIKFATGEFIILMNNDIVLLEQEKNTWLQLLTDPFSDPKTGITGPVKFDWNCGGIRREAMAFWLVMMKRSLFNEIGLLDEIFSPGMGEDGDFSIKAVQKGYTLVSVPNNIMGEFDTGVVNTEFPIWHKGNGTFADDNVEKNSIIQRNTRILEERYGKKNTMVKYSIVIPTYNHFHDAFKPCIDSVLQYTDLSDKEIIIVPNGCTDETKSYLDQLINTYPQIKYLWINEPAGYIGAVNAGIGASIGEYVITFDNDCQLLQQPKDQWLDILNAPFVTNPTVGATSPFAHEYEDLGFVLHSGCTMYRTDVLRKIGMFDNAYHPGYFSDSDVSMKIWIAGYECVEVPFRNDNKLYENNTFSIQFPVMHLGKVQTMDKVKDNEIVKKNRDILYARYGKKMSSNINKWGYEGFDTPQPYDDITTYRKGADYLKDCASVEDWGCGTTFFSTVLSKGIAYKGIDGSVSKFVATPIDLVSYKGSCEGLYMRHVLEHNHQWEAILKNALQSFSKKMVLVLFTPITNKTTVIANNPNNIPDISFSISDILRHIPCKYSVEQLNTRTQYGVETIIYIEKDNKMNTNKKYSIVIPTYNHCDDLLKPCVESILKFTDMSNVEVIIVANGCTDDTGNYVNSLGSDFKLIWSDDALGYTKATNLGINATTGDYVILLNNDTVLLEQPQNLWLNLLEAPFADPSMGITGPLELFDRYANHSAMIFFCVMIKRAVFNKIGILDEIFSPGGGEDIDFTVRANNAGFKSQVLAPTKYNGETNVSDFPIWHVNNKTFGEIPEYGNYIVKRNGLINCKKYNKNIKLNLGAGGVDYQDYLSVDLNDKRAHIHMDITKLDFDDNSVTEILASHVFEHLNPYKAFEILQDWLRVLKPGGKLIMEMPDIEKVCRAFLEADLQLRYGLLNVIYGSVNTTDTGDPSDITSPHLFGWWPQSMYDHLMGAGYENVVFMDEQIPHPGHNFRVEANKPNIITNIITPGSIDHVELKQQEPNTYHEIYEMNNYNVQESEIKGKTVIDIGANLGMFSMYCLERGARDTIAVEAQPTVYNLGLLNNVKQFNNIKSYNLAASDIDNKTVYIPNNHVGSVVGSEGEPVQTITLKTLLENNGVNGDDLVLKMDCEGSEFNVIMTTDFRTMRRFGVIYMELHGNTNHDPKYKDITLVEQQLRNYGFKKVYQNQQFRANEQGVINIPMDVYVQKWERI